MPDRKIVDETEVIRWFEEGRSYAWMQAQYRRKYGIETVPSMWGDFRRRRTGLDRRLERNDDLIPWDVARRHRWAYPVMMLRTEARRRTGLDVAPAMLERLDSWLERLRHDNTVVDYDPTTEDGFTLVPRRPGIDHDLIHEPDQKTTRRPNAGP